MVKRRKSVNLDNYIIWGDYEKFKSELLGGFIERSSYCVEIMKRAFGDDYNISPILSHTLSDWYERAVEDFLKSNKIVKVREHPNNSGEVSVFTTSYKLA
jgi:hypothetical protein